MRVELRAGLLAAMKARDRTAVQALRSALAAIDNAEAVDPALAAPMAVAHPDVAGSVAGPRAAEVERLCLSEAQVQDIVRTEVTERQAIAEEYERTGHPSRAQELRDQAGVLARYLPDSNANSGSDATGPDTTH